MTKIITAAQMQALDRRAISEAHIPATTLMERAGSGVVSCLEQRLGPVRGKTVTVVFGLPNNAAFLKDLTQDLKRACGTGGTATDDGVELQGDLRERVRDLLRARGFLVKG